MHPVGWTNIALATEMGWHMLSPDEPFTTARDYSDSKLQKILILLTDGVQTIEAMGPTGEISIDGANQHHGGALRQHQGVRRPVFTIAYDVDDTSSTACSRLRVGAKLVFRGARFVRHRRRLQCDLSTRSPKSAWLSR